MPKYPTLNGEVFFAEEIVEIEGVDVESEGVAANAVDSKISKNVNEAIPAVNTGKKRRYIDFFSLDLSGMGHVILQCVNTVNLKIVRLRREWCDSLS